MKSTMFAITCLFLLSCPMSVSPSHAADTPLSGLELAWQVFNRDVGKTSVSTATMVLVSKRGNKRIRTFKNFRKRKGDLETQLIRFTAPADINGTTFLTVEKEGWKTDQFLYLPALRRTRRIVSSQKSSSFVNSDFSYEDMERHAVDDYDYKITGSITTAGVDCHILETTPKPGIDSQYSKAITHVAKFSLVPVYGEFFNKKNQLIKRYKVLKLEKIQGIWTASAVLMENIKKKHKTYIKLQHIEYNIDMDESLLSRQAMEKN